MKLQHQFILIMAAAIVVSFIPVLNWPFTWIQTFFHEISHGLAAIVTGGSVSSIQIHLSGSGLCYTSGGIRFIVTVAGYFGATLFGVLLVLSVSATSPYQSKALAIILASITLGALLFWARDIVTILILLTIAAVSLLPIKGDWHPKAVHILLKFIGCYVLLDAIKSPLWLIDGRNLGDGATLSQLTFIPELVWVTLWELFALAGVWFVWKSLQRLDSTLASKGETV
ncbi:MAG: M50 family metallopeptidase [Gammaproteobacteria bacterium]|nr:M50 family metallopeptidase [Gammaproteobacteria bacterium]MCF6230132.1 M50 family metallopeptidase [Gammaproteobacteria bacterium]